MCAAQVRWAGCSAEEDSWEPEGELQHTAAGALAAFHSSAAAEQPARGGRALARAAHTRGGQRRLASARGQADDGKNAAQEECDQGAGDNGSRVLVPKEQEEGQEHEQEAGAGAVGWRELARRAHGMPRAAHRGTPTHEARWDATLRALRAFMNECSRYPSAKYPGESFLGQWTTKCRGSKRKGLLSAHAIGQLDALPGWEWNPKRGPRRGQTYEVQKLLSKRDGEQGQAEFLVRGLFGACPWLARATR